MEFSLRFIPSRSPDPEVCDNQNNHPEHCNCEEIERADILRQLELLKAHADAADYTEAMEVEDSGRRMIKISFQAKTEGLVVEGIFWIEKSERPLAPGWKCGYCGSGRFLVLDPGEKCLTCGAEIIGVEWFGEEPICQRYI